MPLVDIINIIETESQFQAFYIFLYVCQQLS